MTYCVNMKREKTANSDNFQPKSLQTGIMGIISIVGMCWDGFPSCVNHSDAFPPLEYSGRVFLMYKAAEGSQEMKHRY